MANGLTDSYCWRCQYYGREHHGCDYILIEDTMRGCPPGRGCTKRVIGKRKVVTSGIKRTTPLSERPVKPKIEREIQGQHLISVEENARRMELYNLGMNDKEIAEICGVRTPVICAWRRRRKLPSIWRRK